MYCKWQNLLLGCLSNKIICGTITYSKILSIITQWALCSITIVVPIRDRKQVLISLLGTQQLNCMRKSKCNCLAMMFCKHPFTVLCLLLSHFFLIILQNTPRYKDILSIQKLFTQTLSFINFKNAIKIYSC